MRLQILGNFFIRPIQFDQHLKSLFELDLWDIGRRPFNLRSVDPSLPPSLRFAAKSLSSEPTQRQKCNEACLLLWPPSRPTARPRPSMSVRPFVFFSVFQTGSGKKPRIFKRGTARLAAGGALTVEHRASYVVT